MNKSKIIAYIQKWYFLRYIIYKVRKRTVEKDPKKEMTRRYRQVFNQAPNFTNPKNLIEKIYWLLLNTDTSLWTICADKYLMRDYVTKCGYGDYLPKLLGKWDKASEVDFTALPNQFILKTNNGCGTCLIVNDKSKINERDIKHQLKNWLSIPYGYSGAELHYLKIRPCIIAEELLISDEKQKSFSPHSLVDYKVWCFSGKPECVLIVYDRYKRNGCKYSLDLYDLKWNKIAHNLKQNGHFEYKESIIPQPECLEEIIEISRRLSDPFPQVRVDFYIINNKPIIGELTFTTGFGYFTDVFYDYLGSKVILY